jgi:hypothetical protein
MRKPFARGLDEPRTDVIPMIAWATASVTTSASVRMRLGVLRRLRQEIVSGTEHSNQQQVAVGEHRVPPRSTLRIGAADFDLTASITYRRDATSAVELLI